MTWPLDVVLETHIYLARFTYCQHQGRWWEDSSRPALGSPSSCYSCQPPAGSADRPVTQGRCTYYVWQYTGKYKQGCIPISDLYEKRYYKFYIFCFCCFLLEFALPPLVARRSFERTIKNRFINQLIKVQCSCKDRLSYNRVRNSFVLFSPTSVDPVKATLSTSEWLEIAAPAVNP